MTITVMLAHFYLLESDKLFLGVLYRTLIGRLPLQVVLLGVIASTGIRAR